ncbi:hypothetical protein A2U01_0087733, partial [Trifolium medium]|nr:hypothetical protein [Trifolium medium]
MARRASQLEDCIRKLSDDGASRSFIWCVAYLHCSSRATRRT